MRTTHPLAQAFGRSFGPAELKELMTIFDEVWASLMTDGFARGTDVAAQRNRLATIVLELARDGQLGALQVTRTASRLMRGREVSRTARQR